MKTATLERKTFETTSMFVPCDRCGARSLTKFTLDSGCLYFCGHHANEHDEKLKEVAIDVYDKRIHERAS